MVTVAIGELRDHVSQYVRRAEKGETIIIVNRRREVAILQPWPGRSRSPKRLLGALKGTARTTGNLLEPIAPPSGWFRR
jgi:prevent-host-death family protein